MATNVDEDEGAERTTPSELSFNLRDDIACADSFLEVCRNFVDYFFDECGGVFDLFDFIWMLLRLEFRDEFGCIDDDSRRQGACYREVVASRNDLSETNDAQ